MNYLEGISFVPTTKETRREKKSKKKKNKKKKKHKKKNNNNLNVNLNNSSSVESNDEDNNIIQEKQLYHITKQPPPETLSFEELLAKANGAAPISSISSQPPQTLSFEELLAKAKAKDDNNAINNNNNINTRISPIISSRRNNIRKHESIQPSKLDPNKAAAEAIKRQLLGLEPTNTPTNEEYNDDAPPATNNPMNNPRLFKKRKAELIEQRKLHHLNHDNNQQRQKNNNKNNNSMKTKSIMSNRFHKEGETFDPANARGTSISSNMTSSDLDSIFIKNVLKRGKRFKGLMMETGGTGDHSTELDMSLFTDNRTNSQKQNAIRSNAGRNQQRYNQIVQHDQYNINNNHFPKHLIISMNQYAYLMLPRNKPITNGHCLIVPLQPIKSMTQADNDLNNEIANYKHSLLQMFHHEKRSCIFLETVMNINRSHHTSIHCIPIEDDIAEESPIHFQQAILNSDTEWSSHKKIINTSHANHINQAIPPNFSYFHVEICHVKKPKVGYGHIIEDAKKFSPYFGQDVVNDLLGNPPSRFGRKEDKRLNFNAQRELVIKFKQNYCKYDVVVEKKKKGGD